MTPIETAIRNAVRKLWGDGLIVGDSVDDTFEEVVEEIIKHLAPFSLQPASADARAVATRIVEAIIWMDEGAPSNPQGVRDRIAKALDSATASLKAENERLREACTALCEAAVVTDNSFVAPPAFAPAIRLARKALEAK